MQTATIPPIKVMKLPMTIIRHNKLTHFVLSIISFSEPSTFNIEIFSGYFLIKKTMTKFVATTRNKNAR